MNHTAQRNQAITIEELDKKFEIINRWSVGVYGDRQQSDTLFDFLHHTDEENLDWTSIRHLRIIGNDDSILRQQFRRANIPFGTHLNADLSWMLVILPEDAQTADYLARCGASLESLRLHHCILPESLPVLSRFSRLHELTLQDCVGIAELPELAQLTKLRSLRLYSCPRLVRLPEIGHLSELTNLQVFRCIRLATLPRLDQLTQLTSLEIIACPKLTHLPGLGKLTQLDSLCLHDIKATTALFELKKLRSLKHLTLSFCHSLIELRGLENLAQLTDLTLSDCKNLTALPGLEMLCNLTQLNLSNCRSLTTLPELKNLTQLTHLTLSDLNCFTDLPGLENLESLIYLSLSNCKKLETLSGLGNLTELVRLDLSGCDSLRNLPDGLRKCRSLRSLGLRYLHLEDLPHWLPEIAETFVNYPYAGSRIGKNAAHVLLNETTIDSIHDMSIFNQPVEMVQDWFDHRKRDNTQDLNEVKVVFLGDGEAGKSYTIARLMNDGGNARDYVGSATPGISINRRDHTFGGRTFRVNYWDFGGQEIMHSMHRIFLTERTMYVVLVNARDSDPDERARYWLQNLESFAPKAPVLLVLNKIDQDESATLSEFALRARFPKLTQIVRLSALEFTQEEFTGALTNVLLDEILKTRYLDNQWPREWIALKNRMEEWNDAPYIKKPQYRKFCEACAIGDNQDNLLRWFNDLGISFSCQKDAARLDDYVILQPDWITNALYIILCNPLKNAKNGLIPIESITDILCDASTNPKIRCTVSDQEYDCDNVKYILGIMRKFKLSFNHNNTHEFIPMLCRKDPMVNLLEYEQDTKILEFNMVFDYLPSNLLHRLMVALHQDLDMEKTWRTGAGFRRDDKGFRAEVAIDGNTLRFFIQHTDDNHRPNEYLTTLKYEVDKIAREMGLKLPRNQLIYKANDTRSTFDLDILKLRQEVGYADDLVPALKARVAIDEILNQSAPDGRAEENRLLLAIQESCLNIQNDRTYAQRKSDGRGLEDMRNRRIRDDLRLMQYTVNDQTQNGLSSTGISTGELDLLLFDHDNHPWTIIEALRISGRDSTNWRNHLDKLIGNYNSCGLPSLFLLTYVDTDSKTYSDICDFYRTYIPQYNPGVFQYRENSLLDLNNATRYEYTKAFRCEYTCGRMSTTVYHIFVRIQPIKS